MTKSSTPLKFALSFISFLAISSSSLAGVCDISWDGNRLGEITKGQPPTNTMRLNDNKQSLKAQLTVAQIQAVFEAKEEISRQVGRKPNFVFCDATSPNAYAMPTPNGDVVGVTIGMIKLLDGDRDMAAIVIGHEYAHLLKGHARSAQTSDVLLNVASAIIGAVLETKIQRDLHVQGLGTNLANMGAAMTSAKFSRDHEREADELGFNYMLNAGFNPMGAVRLSRLMNREGGDTIGLFFDSHPGWEERESLFSQMIKTNPRAQSMIASTGSRSTPTSYPTPPVKYQNLYRGVERGQVISPEAQAFNEGLRLYRAKDFSAAANQFKTNAANQHSMSQYILGVMYANGQGVPKDEKMALYWYRKSAALGSSIAMNNLGVMYEKGQGGLPKDYALAVEWFRKAAEQGNALGQRNLGFMYEKGQGGLPKDDALAVEWYRKAAEQGHANGQTNLGFMYVTGRGGLPKDYALAVEWFRKAAEQGHANGQFNLGIMYANGRGVPKDDAIAVEWYRKAAEQGDANGQLSLGIMYANGRGGLPSDDAIVVEWYRKAAEQGLALAQANLGFMYASGRGGLPKDEALAVEWYRKAAEQGNSQGQNNLGWMYENGLGGLPKDRALALELYKKAADQGNQLAKNNLERLNKT